jgi:long-subunit acyl-CoA synthetase (AMP-forming)
LEILNQSIVNNNRVIADFGLIMQGIVVVPIHYTLTPNELSSIIGDLKMQVVICSEQLAPKFLSLGLKIIVQLSPYQDKMIEGFTKLYNIKQVEEIGKKNPQPLVHLKQDGKYLRSGSDTEKRSRVFQPRVEVLENQSLFCSMIRITITTFANRSSTLISHLSM